MVKFLSPFAAAGLAVAALALAVPATGHAAGTGGKPCSLPSKGHPLQHLGKGHTTFDDSHNNCVDFTTGTDGTAVLDDSDGNSLVMGGKHNEAELKDSDNNTITFNSGSFDNELNAKGADGNTVVFTSAAISDFVLLLGTHDTGTITISATGASLLFTSACVGNQTAGSSFNGKGTEKHPIKVC